MTDYAAPLQDMHFAMRELAGFADIAALSGDDALSEDMLTSIMEEGAKLAGGVLGPLNTVGDTQGSHLENGVVRTPDGWADAYKLFIEGGWNGAPFDPDFGGQGLPWLVGTGLQEMWHSSNMAFGLCPMLTQAAVEAIGKYGSDEQKRLFLEKLTTGEWTGTMNLTEPQAGSDLAAIRTQAVPEGDHYRITGQKIYITYGDHELTPNIIHMVLARLPDAPEGVKGISLFIVPKYLVDTDGSIGSHNDVRCVSLEHKLGIHASPTAVMQFGDDGGALGLLVGEPNRGLQYMFTMMNNARLSVGLQGVAIAERALQKASAYARERVQGRPIDGSTAGGAPIIRHPDVRRMLLTMRALTEASRGLAYFAAAQIDHLNKAPTPEAGARAQATVDFLIPIVKAWSTDIGSEVASIGVQVHGGMGFIEETGAAQYMRDAKIAEIYEGTNGIQANDLIGRKVARDQGATAKALMSVMAADYDRLAAAGDEFSTLRRTQADGLSALERATDWIVERHSANPNDTAAGAVPYLRMWGVVLGGWLMGKAALAAREALESGSGEPAFAKAKITTAKFYGEHILPRALAEEPAATAGADTLMAMADDAF